jgi:hypothetical protein
MPVAENDICASVTEELALIRRGDVGGSMDDEERDTSGGDEPAFEPAEEGPSVDDTPTISCSRCDRSWDLAYELDELQVGNRAVERFALDHRRHTGHFPDDVTPWVVDCRQCPDGDSFLSERPARRWAETHARHTAHTVDIEAPDGGASTVETDSSSD